MKKYYYKGKEISKKKANIMVIGAILGMCGGALGLYFLMTCLTMIGHIIQ